MFRGPGKNHVELRSLKILIVSIVQALVDLVQTLVALVQAHPPQGGLILVVKRQVVVGPGSGLVGSVWWIFVMVRWEQICHSQVVCGLGVRLDESGVSGQRDEPATLTLMLHQGCNSGGWRLNIYYIDLVQS